MYKRITFSKKVREAITDAQNYYCAGCLEKIHSFHHKISNTKANQKKYPLFLQSPFNCVGLCDRCHRIDKYRYKIAEPLVKVYEQYLKELKNDK